MVANVTETRNVIPSLEFKLVWQINLKFEVNFLKAIKGSN